MTLGLGYEADLSAIQTAQRHPSRFLDMGASVFSSLPGGAEVSGIALLALLAGLSLYGRRVLAGRLPVVFVATGLAEFAMKPYLPQALIEQETVRIKAYVPLVTPGSLPERTHAAQRNHLWGIVCLSESRFLRVGIVLILLMMAASQVYLGVHWASDVAGGVPLGISAVLRALEKENPNWRSR